MLCQWNWALPTEDSNAKRVENKLNVLFVENSVTWQRIAGTKGIIAENFSHKVG